jgi:hypothetical protein
MKFSIEEFINLNLSPNAYMLLYAIVIDDTELYNHIVRQMAIQGVSNDVLRMDILLELQEFGYIKIHGDGIWIVRQKALDLRAQINPEPQFDEFWNKYHEITDQKKTDLQAALKYWKKLTKTEKRLAIDNIKPYFYSLPVYSTGRPVKKARTYLDDKNFNDEFSYKEEKSSINKMI